MELTIPYKWTSLELNTQPNGNILLTLSDDLELQHHLISELMVFVSYEDFIEAIGTEEFEKMIEFYNTKLEE
jgi:hypothetical protein